MFSILYYLRSFLYDTSLLFLLQNLATFQILQMTLFLDGKILSAEFNREHIRFDMPDFDANTFTSM